MSKAIAINYLNYYEFYNQKGLYKHYLNIIHIYTFGMLTLQIKKLLFQCHESMLSATWTHISAHLITSINSHCLT